MTDSRYRRRWRVRAALTFDATGRRVDAQVGEPDFFWTRRGAERFARQMRGARFSVPLCFVVERVT